MATWEEFSAAEPDLAGFGHGLLHGHGIGLGFLATVRSDDDVFELNTERADATTWVNWAQADTYAVRRKWVGR